MHTKLQRQQTWFPFSFLFCWWRFCCARQPELTSAVFLPLACWLHHPSLPLSSPSSHLCHSQCQQLRWHETICGAALPSLPTPDFKRRTCSSFGVSISLSHSPCQWPRHRFREVAFADSFMTLFPHQPSNVLSGLQEQSLAQFAPTSLSDPISHFLWPSHMRPFPPAVIPSSAKVFHCSLSDLFLWFPCCLGGLLSFFLLKSWLALQSFLTF